jgi:hypothetical protein
MTLRDLVLYERAGNGTSIAPGAARSLGLPMPEDVLEQFVIDHGLNPQFQRRYGDLDLRRVRWTKERLSVATIERCSYNFEQRVESLRQRFREAASWEETGGLSSEAVHSWKQDGTWLRAPIFLFDVLPSPDEHHLVEGHTRTGALLGLAENEHGLCALLGEHECWVGRPSDEPIAERERSGEAPRHVSFHHWLREQYGDEDPHGNETEGSWLAGVIVDAEAAYRYGLDGFEPAEDPDLADLLELVDHASSEVAPGDGAPRLSKADGARARALLPPMHEGWRRVVG